MYVRNACLNKIWNILCVLPVLPIFKVVLDTYFRNIFPNYSFWRYTCVCDTALFTHMYFYEQQQFSHHIIIIIIITIIRKTTGCSQYFTVFNRKSHNFVKYIPIVQCFICVNNLLKVPISICFKCNTICL